MGKQSDEVVVEGVVLVPEHGVLPGRLRQVSLPAAEVGVDGLQLPRMAIRDVRGGAEFADGSGSAPQAAGGPTYLPEARRANRCFGVFNVAWHLSNGFALVEELLGRPLPPLVVRVGEHLSSWPRWSGGHYRLPAERNRIPEAVQAETGEVHLGGGRRFVPYEGGWLWGAAAYNPAIILHEFGHHVVRHTADPRGNRWVAASRQSNRKTALDEGTADYIAAVLLATPDIYGWHRAGIPYGSLQRRNLDAGWTMAVFQGGPSGDPHDDGSIWAGALWAARAAVAERTGAPTRFDALLLDALARMGRADRGLPHAEVRRRRRCFSAGLEWLLLADDASGTGLGGLVERAFADRGIVTGATNAQLQARCTLPPQLRSALSVAGR